MVDGVGKTMAILGMIFIAFLGGVVLCGCFAVVFRWKGKKFKPWIGLAVFSIGSVLILGVESICVDYSPGFRSFLERLVVFLQVMG